MRLEVLLKFWDVGRKGEITGRVGFDEKCQIDFSKEALIRYREAVTTFKPKVAAVATLGIEALRKDKLTKALNKLLRISFPKPAQRVEA